MGEVGLYVEGRSVIHNLDPRVKLLWFVFVLAASIVCQFDGSVSLFIFLSLVVGMALAGLPLKRLLLIIGYSIVFFIVTILVWASYYQDVGRYLFTFAGVRVTDTGLLVGTGKFFLIINPIVSMLIFFSTVKPYDLVQVFSRIGLPYKAGFMLLLSLRMLSLAVSELRNIMDVQKARGIEVDSRNPFKRVANLIPVFVPLVIRIMSLAWELSITLMVRGFGYSRERSYAFPLRWSPRDTIAIILIAIFYTGIIAVKLAGFSTYYMIAGV